MSKIAIINDTHFGVKNAADVFLAYQEDFFVNQFFPFCKKNGITKVIHLGDFYEHRKYVAVKTLSKTQEFFLQNLSKNGMTMDIIPGNHDVAFRNTNSLCTLTEVLSLFPNIVNVFMEPTVNDYDGLQIALLPWINTENYDDSIKFIASNPAPILMGHLELQGFEMMRGAPVQSHGMSSALFKNYEMVLSGHYHTKSNRGNITYLGTQYELTWADADDPKYFHVLDTKTRKLTPHRNNKTIHKRLFYDDRNYGTKEDAVEYISSLDYSQYTDNYVRIVVTGKRYHDVFVDLEHRIYNAKPFEVKIIDSIDDVSISGETIDNVSDINSIADTFSIITTTIESLEIDDIDKERVKQIAQEIWTESNNAEAIDIE